MWRRGWALPQRSALLVQLQSRPLEVLDHPLGELVPGIVRGMLSKEPAGKVAAPGQGEADREHELSAERVMTHGTRVLVLFASMVSRSGRPCQGMLGAEAGAGWASRGALPAATGPAVQSRDDRSTSRGAPPTVKAATWRRLSARRPLHREGIRTNPVLDLTPAHRGCNRNPARARGDQAPVAVVPRPFLGYSRKMRPARLSGAEERVYRSGAVAARRWAIRFA